MTSTDRTGRCYWPTHVRTSMPSTVLHPSITCEQFVRNQLQRIEREQVDVETRLTTTKRNIYDYQRRFGSLVDEMIDAQMQSIRSAYTYKIDRIQFEANEHALDVEFMHQQPTTNQVSRLNPIATKRERERERERKTTIVVVVLATMDEASLRTETCL
jgi:hypothetical protein